MVPPLETPAPSRFLPPIKRQNLQRVSNTPGQTRNDNQERTSAGPNNFRATPRFSTSSTPRPGPASQATTSAFTTPSLTLKTLKTSRLRTTQDVIDDEEDSPEPLSSRHSPTIVTSLTTTKQESHHYHLPEPVELGSSYISQSPINQPSHSEGRLPKRRRISITSSPTPSHFSDQQDQQQQQGQEETLSITSSPTPSHNPLPTFADLPYDPLIPSTLNDISDASVSGASSPAHSLPSSPTQNQNEHTSLSPNQKQPIFRPPPAFRRVPGDSATTAAAQPDMSNVFSPPQRRGDRYLPGGLAAELRDWLIEAKESEVDAEQPHSSVRLGIEEVRNGGPGMRLILGQVLGENGEVGPLARAILAGEGGNGNSVEGLGGGRRDAVVEGGVVSVMPPAWDVELDGRWAVAYRWEVVRGREGDG